MLDRVIDNEVLLFQVRRVALLFGDIYSVIFKKTSA